MKRALITGITGQDGSYLAEFLLKKGYLVYGLVRRTSTANVERLAPFLSELSLIEGDLTDAFSVQRALDISLPNEVYNLAAMSHVGSSFEAPAYTTAVNALGALHVLEAAHQQEREVRVYQASTSELFGKVQETPQNETTPFYPRSPYGVSKLYAYWAVVNYREAHRLYACNGILFNHESPRRAEAFVSRKITLAAARISAGMQQTLSLGNLNACRDWGYAEDFVEGMWLMLQQPEAEDFVLATGVSTSVRRFVELSFAQVGIEIEWEGEGVYEKGRERNSGRILIEVSPEFFRPAEVDILLGDASKARRKLGWEPKTSVEDLVSLMVNADLAHYANSFSS